MYFISYPNLLVQWKVFAKLRQTQCILCGPRRGCRYDNDPNSSSFLWKPLEDLKIGNASRSECQNYNFWGTQKNFLLLIEITIFIAINSQVKLLHVNLKAFKVMYIFTLKINKVWESLRRKSQVQYFHLAIGSECHEMTLNYFSLNCSFSTFSSWLKALTFKLGSSSAVWN